MDFQERYNHITETIHSTARKARREPNEITFVAVTKNAQAADLQKLLELGHRDLGESKLQHLQQRAVEVEPWLGDPPQSVRWHMIGHLQRNKVKATLQLASLVHSVDSLRLAEEIQIAATRLEKTVAIMLEVNTGEESTKYGVAVGAAQHLAEQIDTMEGVHLVGLMTMAPRSENAEDSRRYFVRLREIFEEIKFRKIGGTHFRHLSMGMTQDYAVAIEEGATMVRIGTALFGEGTPEE